LQRTGFSEWKRLDRHPRGDPVPPLGPVQGDASDATIGLIEKRLHEPTLTGDW
jgi:hypothetical protein